MTVDPQTTPVTQVSLDSLPSDQPAAAIAPSVAQLPRGSSHRWRKAFGSASGIFGLIWLGLLIIAAIFAPLIAPHSPYDQELSNALQGPSSTYWMGTDNLGRDVFSRILYGASVSLWVPLLVVVLTLLGAIPIGLWAGYRGRKTDQVLMRLMDSGLSFPPIVLALAVVAVLGPGLRNTTIALAIVFMPSMARLIRGQTLVVREESFIEASRSLGSRSTWIVLRRVLPNIVSVIIVQSTLIMATSLIAEASLSFLGLGAQPPAASWGGMLQQAYSTSLFIKPSSLFWPGLALALTVLAFNAIGDSLSSALGLVQFSRKSKRGSKKRGANKRRQRRGITTVDRGAAAVAPLEADPALCLEIRNLSVAVETDHGRLPVVQDINFSVKPGEIVGLVGESGSGKSVTSLSIMRLAPSAPFVITSGNVILGGKDLLSLELNEMRKVRGGEVSMVFQDPMSSLNPAQTVGKQIAETVRLHRGLSRKQAWERAVELLERVGIPDPAKRASSYPHQLSGGMRQRVMIAMALSCEPRLIIADEPTTALDVTIQAQVLELLRDLARKDNVAIVFVTHDLAVVSELCDRVLVMYAGQIVEVASTEQVFASPQHPYTEGLIGASRHSAEGEAPQAIPGQVPRLDEMPTGCRFAQRCMYSEPECIESAPALKKVEPTSRSLPIVAVAGRLSRCRRQPELELQGVR